MLIHKTSDLHLHLNGSFTLGYLRKVAARNNCLPHYEELSRIHHGSVNSSSEKETANLVWKKFGLVHQIIKTPLDIREGVADVLSSSTAHYLEIRTTPKDTADFTSEQYIQTFIKGLIDANKANEGSKSAYGLLSLDRTLHDEAAGLQMVDRVLQEKTEGTGLLVGIDLSGNPFGKRTLTGSALAKVIHYALSKDLGLALHLGEANTPEESDEVDLILSCLREWRSQQPNNGENPFFGKVRLGHAIYLNDAQRAAIRDLQIPIEICPTCHTRINWWNGTTPHPVQQIYSSWKDPISSGTDDSLIFNCDGKSENKLVLRMFGYKAESFKEAREHQSQFRFHPAARPRKQ